MAIDIGRRQFISALGGLGVAWPLAARAQQPAMPVVGYLYAGSPEQNASLVTAFRKGLNEAGFIKHQNVVIEYRWTRNDNEQLPEMAADLVRRQVSVIVTPNFLAAALAAKSSTTTIPIVFGGGFDPVQAGLVASLNRPGGNVTGISFMTVELGAKRLGLLHELLPRAARFAMLVNPNNPNAEFLTKDAEVAAAALGQQIEILAATTNHEIDTAFASIVQNHADALVVSPEPLFADRRVQLVTLAVRHAVPTIYPIREFVEIGGLMSYGPNFADQHRQVGVYTGRILNGDKPADLPILRPTKFNLVINLQTARTLGIIVPQTLLAGADEVIE